ncbi:MAG: helix-turn-helix transcriptional regulator [Proteobacteria bacterium]|nr:helix-turn-helix transcriptional regulator [Pseudomonadota bacterium]
MTNIASVLKSEISRIARKEVRAELDSLKKASAQYRSAIALLKREVVELQKQLRRSGSAAAAEAKAAKSSDAATSRRFSAARLAAHRSKLGLSAAAYGNLVGMSGATIYLWEQGKSRPNAEQLQRLAAVRVLGKRAALAKAAGLLPVSLTPT